MHSRTEGRPCACGTKEGGKPAAAPLTCGLSAGPHYGDLAPQGADCTHGGPAPMRSGSEHSPERLTPKTDSLQWYRASGREMALTDPHGARVADDQNTLSAGERGPLLLEDFHFVEKLAHFGRERIPERVVHARGSGAHGWFQPYQSCADITKAAFLSDPDVKTPVFVRFSTVQGARGSADTVRDIRGFAVKFYTSEGNFDLVGNDTPVFFIQDPVKFPDFVHAVKPEPHNEVPQGQSAHDSLWDFVSLQPETLHNIMWAMSDRGIPRSYRTMEGFGIHTYRMVDASGKACFVRFHWKPAYGKASLVWDEAHLLTGRDPDFHRKDLWQAIEAGDFPEYELGLQVIPEEDEDAFGFDILDPTKLIPEAVVPVRIVGRMVLDRNPDDFFAETEQAAFCPANLVPGIDFSDDPLLQGRTFSYTDTQRHRLGSPNFHELPINRPLAYVRNNERAGQGRIRIDSGANYGPNSISGNWPRETPPAPAGGGFHSVPAAPRGDATPVRRRSPSFEDYYSQPRLFWMSQTPVEQAHIAAAFAFELSKVVRPYIRERVVDLLARIDTGLASCVAEKLGITLTDEQLTRKMPAPVCGLDADPSLSLYASGRQVLKGRRVCLLAADGVSGGSVERILSALREHGVHGFLLAPHMGWLETAEGGRLRVDGLIEGEPSVLFDAVIVPEGRRSIEALSLCGHVRASLRQAFRHLKAIALPGEASALRLASGLPDDSRDPGLIVERDTASALPRFLEAMGRHRIWEREERCRPFSG